MMHWGSPGFLNWIWLSGVVFLMLVFLDRLKKKILTRYGNPKLLSEMSLSLDERKRRWKYGLMALAVLVIVLALADPRLPGRSVYVQRKGFDIVIAVDVSMSMLAQDISPSRLEKAKLELLDLVDRAKGDRLGVVAFAGQAIPQVPLTHDRSAVKLFIKTLSPSLIPIPGTAVGDAIRSSLALFPQEESQKNRAIILLTDGEDHGSEPRGAAEEARKKGVRIYPIGIGTRKGDVIAYREGGKIQFKKDLKGNKVVSRLDEKLLLDIARITQGGYYRSRKGSLEIDRIYAEVSQREGNKTGSGWVIETEPLYAVPILFGLLFLGLEMILTERRKGL